MAHSEIVHMLLLHPGTARDRAARSDLANVLPEAKLGEPDATGAFELSIEADDREDALTRVWNAIAASGTDDHIVFFEHADLPEHWRSKSKGLSG
jgi:hypothetical protein